jgi:DNA-binding response OmpR family regulator
MAKILIVDDEPGLRLLYCDELGEEGYEVVAAADGAEATRLLAKGDIDLVVLDIQLKQESGLETLQQMVKAHKDLPVILSSAYDCYKDDFSSWLADAYVVKSSDLTELKNQVSRLLSAKASRK